MYVYTQTVYTQNYTVCLHRMSLSVNSLMPAGQVLHPLRQHACDPRRKWQREDHFAQCDCRSARSTASHRVGPLQRRQCRLRVSGGFPGAVFDRHRDCADRGHVEDRPRLSYCSSEVTLVGRVLQELGLSDCASSRVGMANDVTLGGKGISGAKKRRVSIAVQVVSDPGLLCADEPTSGLDAFTAGTVAQCLKALCSGQRQASVVCSIHQPRADIFRMFDFTLLLSKGGTPVHCGETVAMIEYFKQLNHPCPMDSNPADFFVDIFSVDPRSASHHIGV